MTNVVIDTNVLVSAVLSPNGNPAQVLKIVTDSEEKSLYYSSEIIGEYRKVLSYDKLKIGNEEKTRAIDLIQRIGKRINPTVSTITLPDESDRIFYDTAKECGAILVTGNIKHYPTEPSIMTPADFIISLKTDEM